MNLESEVVELRLMVNDLKIQNKSICDAMDDLVKANKDIFKVLKVLDEDFNKRKDPHLDELMGVLYG
jgi:hypothetical protein